jgi:hypothetical protein
MIEVYTALFYSLPISKQVPINKAVAVSHGAEENSASHAGM